MSSGARPVSLAAGTLTLLGGLYFAQGLPFGFFTGALPVVLRESGYSLIQISATGVLFLPWALKFLWAPYVDVYGTRRRWLLVLQCLSAALALAFSFLDLEATLRGLLLGIFVLNIVSATQDVVTDGVAVRLLDTRSRGLGNGIQVGAYRIGMIAGGGVLLWLFSFAGWRILFVAMATMLMVSTIPVLLNRRRLAIADVVSQAAAPSPTSMAFTWWHRLRRPGMIAFILMVGAYKFGNSMGSALVGPFLSDSGLSLRQIALIEGGLSSVAALAGAGLGAWLSFRFGRRHALLVGGVSQTAALLLYVVASLEIGGFPLLVAANVSEHVLGGAATVAVFTLMMDAAQERFAGSDYTLVACAVVFTQGAAGLAAGVVGDLFGFTVMFTCALVLSAAGCAALLIALDRGVGPAELARVVPPKVGRTP